MITEEHFCLRRMDMFKIIGGLLIILACSAFGVEKGRELSMHRKELEELERIFTLIKTKLEYIKMPIEELFANMQNEWLLEISKELKGVSRKNFHEIWISSIDVHFKETFLSKSELEELKQIGKHISRPEAISLYLIQVEEAIKTTREEEKEKKKLYQSMGILSGIFLVLVLT